MKNITIFVSGVMVASAAFAGPIDPMAEERYRMIYGRHTPAEEARRAAHKEVVQDAAGACCLTMHGAPATAALRNDASGEEARFVAKYGRMTGWKRFCGDAWRKTPAKTLFSTNGSKWCSLHVA